MKVLIKEFRKYEKNTLQAFADIEFLDLCLVIKDCMVHQKDGSAWISFPGRSYKSDGETKWVDIVKFSDIEKKEEFRLAAVDAVKRFMEMENEKASVPSETVDDDEIPF